MGPAETAKIAKKMNSVGAPVVDLAEQIKWWDALDNATLFDPNFPAFLRMARECQHPDARWLVSLLRADAVVDELELEDVLENQSDKTPDDARVMFLLVLLGTHLLRAMPLLHRAAEMGYAPAQAHLALWYQDRQHAAAFKWASLAAARGDRDGIGMLASCYASGCGCGKDEAIAIELFKRAAHLSDSFAEFEFGRLAFGGLDWERYFWWGRAATHGFFADDFCRSALRCLPSFEEGAHGRIVHTMAPLLRNNASTESGTVFGSFYSVLQMSEFRRIVELYDAMLGRARRAIHCWSMAGRRCRVVKDMRVMIAKMLWEEAWRWGEKEGARDEKKAKRS
jgi:hypothetical protein